MVCWKFSSILYRSKVIGHFRWCFEFGCNFAFETNFCKFDLWNDPIPYLFLSHIVCLAEMRILSHQAFWSVSSVSRYTHKRLSWKSPLTSRKRGVCGSNFPTGWDIFMGPPKAYPWPKPRRLMYRPNMWDSSARGRLCACRTKHRKQIRQSTISPIWGAEPRSPTYHYELWPTWWSYRRNQLSKFLFWSVKGFLLCVVLKMTISYT